MKIELIGWQARGLRCPDTKIDLCQDGQPAQISLIQMPNGTGKTTTLTMLRAAMNSEATHWSAEKIRQYRRPGEDTIEGNFVLDLRVDEKPLTFEMKFDFVEGAVAYTTSWPGYGGIRKGWDPPSAVRRFLDDRFVKLFVFDGEFAENLLKPNESEASQAIDALFQLYLLEDVRNLAQESWDAESRKSPTRSESGLTKIKAQVEALENRVRKIEAVAEDARKDIGVYSIDIEQLKQRIHTHTGSQVQLRDEFEAKREEEQNARTASKDASIEVMRLVRQPHQLHPAFAASLSELKHQLDRLKLPASSSSQFFEELLEEPQCICGRPLDETHREILKNRAKLYLAEETSGVLNGLKQDIDQYVVNAPEAEVSLLASVRDLGQAVRVHALASQEVRMLHQRLIDQGDTQLKTWEEELLKSENDLKERQLLLKDIEREALHSDDEKTVCLKSLKRQLQAAREKYALITGTVDLHKRTEVLRQIVDRALELSRTNLRSVLTEECNSRLKDVLSRDPIEIERIDSSLKLKNRDGASVGQTLSVGYVFLTTLLSRGQHQFPLVVDSPANPLSMEVRRELARLIPHLCKQFIAFTISSERAAFTEPLAHAASGAVKHITLFRRTPGTQSLEESLPKNGVTCTENSVLVEGIEYFDNFDEHTTVLGGN
jgi:DNA sulfur modification protein DndD